MRVLHIVALVAASLLLHLALLLCDLVTMAIYAVIDLYRLTKGVKVGLDGYLMNVFDIVGNAHLRAQADLMKLLRVDL